MSQPSSENRTIYGGHAVEGLFFDNPNGGSIKEDELAKSSHVVLHSSVTLDIVVIRTRHSQLCEFSILTDLAKYGSLLVA